ncbi:SA1362 family protein [Staphylococcus aureus]|uniref:SA1362 family protein n=1 Tax=Staphylococcus aureus TaxID=1280 RepID=UPI002263FF97|nr:SA1362 family protein [Staphylococcus aureus]
MRNIIFYLVLIIAAIGLVMNLDAFIFSIVRMLVSFAVIAGIIYLIYYFFILTEDKRKYRKAMRKYKRNQRRK